MNQTVNIYITLLDWPQIHQWTWWHNWCLPSWWYQILTELLEHVINYKKLCFNAAYCSHCGERVLLSISHLERHSAWAAEVLGMCVLLPVVVPGDVCRRQVGPLEELPGCLCDALSPSDCWHWVDWSAVGPAWQLQSNESQQWKDPEFHWAKKH